MFWFFFCFKQKTAYEMRISDWSSDVCSSDLLDDRRHRLQGRVPREQDPGVLAHLGDETVDQGTARRLGVDRGEMGLRHQLAHLAGSLAGVYQVVDQQPALAVVLDRFQHLHVALGVVVAVADDAEDRKSTRLNSSH